jgi:hypothetical protein
MYPECLIKTKADMQRWRRKSLADEEKTEPVGTVHFLKK